MSEFAYPFHKGGAERRYYELASRLVARGHDVHWFAMKHWPGEQTTIEGIRLHPACDPIDVYARAGRRSIGAGLRVGWSLTAALRRTHVRFDLIDCSLYPFFHIFGTGAVRRGTPMVVSWYEFWGNHWYEYLGWRGFFGKQLERLAASVPDRIIAVSDSTASALLATGIPAQRIENLPLGVDTTWIDSVPAARNRSDLIFFGRLKNHKNVDLLIRAVALVKERRPDVTCALVGDGPERHRLVALAEELGVMANVRFFGEVSDSEVIALTKASRLLVHPSTKEGGGSLTLLEANACGVPVIAIDHPLGIDRSLIAEGRNGWRAKSPDASELASTILAALQDGQGPESMRHSCREFARQFDWDRIVRMCEDIYVDVSTSRAV